MNRPALNLNHNLNLNLWFMVPIHAKETKVDFPRLAMFCLAALSLEAKFFRYPCLSCPSVVKSFLDCSFRADVSLSSRPPGAA